VVTIKRRGLMFILSAPSGTGKTTLANKLIEIDSHISFSISSTTRNKRSSEVDGKDYYFKDKSDFQNSIKNNDFLEYAEIFDHFYGTPKKQVLEKLDDGQDVLFDIDWQGHRQLCSTARKDVTSVFLLPPSMKELYNRLKSRDMDDEKIIEKRMERADEEISHWHEYDYIIINRDFEESIGKLLEILRAERLKKERRIGLNGFVGTLINEQLVKNKIV
jgi:guanylate kinase